MTDLPLWVYAASLFFYVAALVVADHWNPSAGVFLGYVVGIITHHVGSRYKRDAP